MAIAIASTLSSYVLMSTLVVAIGDNASSNQQWAPYVDEASCKNAIELSLQGKDGIERHDYYVTATVNVAGVAVTQRLQCIPQDVNKVAQTQ